jgi:ATP-dependent RNA helicase RhlE
MSTQPASFETLGIAKPILAALTQRGITVPTPIQEGAIPRALAGHDVLGIAQTGTGKTLAFGVPLITKLLEDPKACAVILVPTRELALQVEASLAPIAKHCHTDLRAISLIGGVPAYRQINELRRMAPRIVVATPGRMNDLLAQRAIYLDQVAVLVLDEADRMLDMGFLPQIERVCESMPKDRQTLLFSATFAPAIATLTSKFQRNPERIEVAPAGTSASTIEQILEYVRHDDKIDALVSHIRNEDGSVLVFARTRHGASKLARKLRTMDIGADELHSDRTLGQRRQALDGFKRGTHKVLVATDVASRGIDITSITLVVNFDLPDAAEDYVHRIGRTGRAGKKGRAITLATLDQRRQVAAIEKLMTRRLALSPNSLAAPHSFEISRRQRPMQNTRRRWSKPPRR